MEPSIKIFVPLGTQKFPFNRLITEINRLIEIGEYKPEEIVMQSSVYEVTPIFTHYSLIPSDEFNQLIEKAEVVVTHSGVNSIISCMRRNKPLVIVPRLHEYDEHVDNHQVEIADLMAEKFNIIVVKEMCDLSKAIKEAIHHSYRPWISKSEELVSSIKALI